MGYQRRVHGELTSEQTHFHSFNAIQILNKSFNRIQILNKNFNGKEFQLDIQSSILSQQLQLQVTIAEGKVDQEREEKWKFKERCWVSLGFPFFFSYQLPQWPGLRIGTHRWIGSAEMHAVGSSTSSKGSGRPLVSRGILSVNAHHRLNVATPTPTPHGGLLSTLAIQRAFSFLVAESNVVHGVQPSS